MDHQLARIERALSEQKHLLIGLERRSRKRAKAPQEAIVRACVCRALAFLGKTDVDQVARTLYPNDADVSRALSDIGGFLKTRAPAPPATTTDLASAGLVQPGYVGILETLAPQSVYAALAARGLRISLAGVSSVPVPRRDDAVTPNMACVFPGEGDPIPVRRIGLTSNVIKPHVAKVLTIFSAELAKHSNFEAILSAIIREDTAEALDSVMLSNAAATADAPGGLLAGVTPLPPTAGGGVAALAGDLAALAGAVDADDLVLLMTPAERVRALTLSPGLAAATILEASTLPSKTVVAIDAAAFVSGEGDEPQFDISDKAVVVNDDGLPVPDFGAAISADIAALKRAMKDADVTVRKTTTAVNDNFNKIGPAADRAAGRIRQSMQASTGDVRNLQFQINDIATGLASGQSPFTIMAQQSGQLSQALAGAGGLRGAVTLLGGAIGGLINPVNIALVAISAAAYAASRYFSDTSESAEEAAKKLDEHLNQLKAIKDRWGEAVPAVKRYVEETERAAQSLKKQEDLKTIITDIFKPGLAAVEATEEAVRDLQSRLEAIGQYDLARKIAEGFRRVKEEVAANRYPLQDVVHLQNLVLQAFGAQVTGAKDVADAINSSIIPALRAAADEASRMTRAYGDLPRVLGGAGPPPPGLGAALRHTETERFEDAMGEAADAIDGFVERVIQAEAPRGGPNLAGASSAYGHGQFLRGTWLETFRKHYAAEAERLGEAGMLALRDDIEWNRRLIRAFASDNAEALIRAGETVSEASLQLAHFLGPGGAIKVLKAAPGTRIADIPGMQAAIEANPKQLGGGATREDVLSYAAGRARGGSERIRQEAKDLDVWLAKSRQAIELRQKELVIDRDITATVSEKNAAKEAEKFYQEGLNVAIKQYGTVSAEQRAQIRATANEMAGLGLASDQMKAAQERATESAKRNREAYEQLANQITQMSQTAVSGFVNDLRNGVSAGEAFGNMLDRVVDGLINMALQSMFAKNALGGVIGQLLGGGGGGGMIAGLPFPAVPVRHSGGEVGPAWGGPRRRVSPALFRGAPRLHNGLMPGEFPAILQKGELVIPKAARRGAAGMVDNSRVYLGDVRVDVQTGMVVASSEDGRQIGERINSAVRSVLVAESRPGGLLRRVPS